MHRGATGFFSEDIFKKFYWPTLREVTEEIFKTGYQTIYYAEGKWAKNLKYFLELPEGSIIFHCDKDDIFEVHKILGKKFAISGGVPNDMLAFGTPEDIKRRVKEVIEKVGKDGGFILDAEAIMQQDTKRENFKAMAEACAEYGVY
jgi:uroporphyrinogen-III decarboxylase